MSCNQCIRCGSKNCVKNGIVRNVQRYRCKECGCNFTVGDKREYNQKFRDLAKILYTEGIPTPAISKVMGVSESTIVRWVKNASKTTGGKALHFVPDPNDRFPKFRVESTEERIVVRFERFELVVKKIK